MSFILIYVTHENLAEAKKVSDHLLQRKLVAGTQFMPVETCYWWKGNIKSGAEYVSLFTSIENNWDVIQEEIKKVHPYDEQCIMKLVVEANKGFEEWVIAETAQKIITKN